MRLTALALTLALSGASAFALDAEYAFRWSPGDGGPSSLQSVIEALKLAPGKTKHVDVQYFDVPQPAGLPTTFKAIGRERGKHGELPEAMFKIRGPEPGPDASLLACPLTGNAEKKLELDITVQGNGEVRRSLSASCTVENKHLAEALPTGGVNSKGCVSKVERTKAEVDQRKLTLEHWQLPQGERYIEVSMKGDDTPADLQKFTAMTAKLLALGARPLDAGKTDLASNCLH